LTSARDFKVHCINPVLNKGAEGFGNIRNLLHLICIRRTKELLDLPKFHAVERHLPLSVEERTRYQDISRAYKVAIDDAICGRKPADAYKFIFRALLDLRTLCNHGSRTMSDEMKDYLSLSQDGVMQCVYCESSVSDEDNSESGLAAIFTTCDHVVCGQCVTLAHDEAKKLESGYRIDCPQCSKPLQSTDRKPAIRFIRNLDSQAIEETSVSTKFSAITEDVRKFSSTDKW
jgi:SWI/SNF-related matrix-associated actin-dependent regulator of chromatin subfamily A3